MKEEADKLEQSLRDRWTAQGVPKEKQDEILAGITAKAQRGAMVGPFKLGEGAFECNCGNRPDLEGFFFCDAAGNYAQDNQDSDQYRCDRCGAIVSADASTYGNVWRHGEYKK
jgi:hypothetical protein